MINVTKTYLPPLDDYTAYLEQIWSTAWVTNNGALVLRLEEQLRHFLNVPHLWYCNNGTIALQFALKALQIQGEVITTPFSYVATASSILWENCQPVFADIDPQTLTIDPQRLESKISPRTRAILATHVFGNPCDVDSIAAIAQKHQLKVIYDAAHCFGVKYRQQSLCNYGDIATLSFHATKLFHTVEGGAVVTQDPHIAQRLYLVRQFGHINDEHFSLGINGKVSELHAAMGLCVLPKVAEFIKIRQQLSQYYHQLLHFDRLDTIVIRPDTDYNYAYYPIIFSSEDQLLRAKKALESQEIMPRRYFYPSLNILPYLTQRDSCPISESVALRILCLPLYVGLQDTDIEKIAHIINQSLC